MGFGFILPTQGKIFAERNLHITVNRARITGAFFGTALRNFRPSGAMIGTPANVRNDERLGLSRLFQMLAKKHRVYPTIDTYDPAILDFDPNGLRHVSAEH